jgi:NMD protein affecting ribosome stability and mRNA decay
MVESTPTRQGIAADQLESHILSQLAKDGEIKDSESIVELSMQTSETVDAALKSLLVDEYVVLDVIEVKHLKLSAEG